MVAFSYQAGYFAYYKIPQDLIEINLTSILIAIIALFSVLWIILSFTNILSLMGLLKRDTALKRSLVATFVSLIPALILSYLLSSYKLLLYVISILFVSYLLAIIFGGFKGKGIEQRLLNQEAIDRELDKSDLFLKFANNVGIYNFRFLITVIMVVWLAYYCGYSKAKNTEVYVFLSDTSQTSIVKIYDDSLIGLEIDEESKTFTNKFTLFDRKNNISFALTNRNIGKLTYLKKE